MYSWVWVGGFKIRFILMYVYVVCTQVFDETVRTEAFLNVLPDRPR